jgi:signal transduction histidine kinase
LVGSLLSFAKQAPAAKSSVDVTAVVQTALKICQPQMQAARVQYETDLTDSLPRVRGDANQLLQVFSHIISNASNAMSGRGGTLTVISRGEGRLVSIQFADTGPGMLEPDRVFDPFYTTRPVGQGTGLGLSACYGIIQEHGGNITCQNRPEGGAVFTIELPAATHSQEQHAQAHAAK